MKIEFKSSYRKEGGRYINGKEVLIDERPAAFFSSYQMDWYGESLIRESIESLIEYELPLNQGSILSETKILNQR